MKRVLKLLFLILLVVPFFCYASSYTMEANNANYYILRSTYKETYPLYLLDGNKYNIPFGYSGSSVVEDNTFKYGGFLSRDEYKLSKRNGSSWLYNGSSYWTLTKEGSKHYTISYSGDVAIDDNNTDYRGRVTEYVLPGTKVSGSGTSNDPWMFEPMYKVTVTTDPTKGKVDESTNNVYKVARCTRSECTANIKVEPLSGYQYISNDCSARYNTTTHMLSINNLTKDVECKVTFGIGLFNIKLTGDGTGASPTEFYLQYKENYYRTDKVTLLSKLDSNPTKIGYTFRGYNYTNPNTNEVVQVIDAVGKFKADAKSKIIGDASVVSEWIANKYTVTFNPDGGSVNPTTKQVTYDNTYGSLPIATKAGYEFLGWKDENGQSVVTSVVVKFAKNHTLTAQWKQCPAGQYASATMSTCGTCPVGTYSLAGAPACTSCPKGQYQASTGQDHCDKCPAGQYQDQLGQTSCKNCTAGKFQKDAGKDKCDDCPSDQWSGEKATSCFSKCNSVKYKETNECNAKCNGGHKKREAYSSYDSSFRCPAKDDYSGGACNSQGCCSSTKTIYGSWSGWGGCSASCGGGTQSRSRSYTYISNYDGRNCGSGTQSESQACNTQSCNCTVYCTTPYNCSRWSKPTNGNKVYAVFTCNASTGRTGPMEQCRYHHGSTGEENAYWFGDFGCNTGPGGDRSKWYWMCTSGELVHCFNWGGMQNTCYTNAPHCGYHQALTLSTSGGYSCSCD